MADPVTIATGVAATGATAAALATDAGKKLITPLAENLGLAIGDLGDIYRFYQKANLGKIFTKWAEVRNKKPVTEDEIQKVLPLLRLASEQTDEDLQARWVALLEHTAASSDDVLPSFGQTLSQLTVGEARFLDRLFNCLAHPSQANLMAGRGPIDRRTLLEVYDASIDGDIDWIEHRLVISSPTPEQIETFAKIERAEVAVADLMRLGILSEEKIAVSDDFIRIPSHLNGHPLDSLAGAKIALHRDNTSVESEYSLTAYGLRFIRAVSSFKAK